MTINNIDELITATGHTDKHDLERSLYKYTDCGMSITFLNNGITLLGYVESDFDYCGPEEMLLFPFTLEDYESTIELLDEKACRIWDILHDDSLSDDEKDIIFDI